MIIQIIGLPGSGKTELAKALKERINAIHLNADEVRATINSDLGFALEDRIEHARRMGDSCHSCFTSSLIIVNIILLLSVISGIESTTVEYCCYIRVYTFQW